jgi:hypothetical protein
LLGVAIPDPLSEEDEDNALGRGNKPFYLSNRDDICPLAYAEWICIEIIIDIKNIMPITAVIVNAYFFTTKTLF